jgi:hypothetical protein
MSSFLFYIIIIIIIIIIFTISLYKVFIYF